MTAPDVIIIGGGVIGAACARWLAGRDLAVRVLDLGSVPGSASPAAPGLLAPLAGTSADDPLLSLKVRGRDIYHDVAPALLEETGVDVGLWTDGIVHVALTPDDLTRFRTQIAWQRQMGFKSNWLPLDELRERFPGISHKALGAKVMPEAGALAPDRLVEALRASARDHGAEFTLGVNVRELVIDGGAVTGVRTESEVLSAGSVLVAAGAWSGRIAGLPRPLSVEPVRGQMLAVDWPDHEPPAIVYGASGYVVHRNGEAVSGTTLEFAGFDASVTDEGIAKLRNTLQSLYPGLEQSTIKRTWAGLRPATPDGQPIIGRDADVDGLWYATGHGRNGVLLAAITGLIISQLFVGEQIEPDIAPIDPARFWRR